MEERPLKRARSTDDPSSFAPPRLLVKKLTENAQLPERGSAKAAGYDLYSAYDYKVMWNSGSAWRSKIAGHGKELIKTDLSLAIPTGYYGRIAPRSSLAWKNHIDVGAGVIDEDYRGPLGVVLFNHGDTEFEIKKGDRVAQLILTKIITPDIVEVDDLDATERGEGGFGSTGKAEIVQKQ